MSLAVVAAGLGFTPHADAPKGVADTSVPPAVTAPPIEAAPTTVAPDTAMVEPPTLTPAIPQRHRSRPSRSQAGQMLAVGSHAAVTPVPAVDVQTPAAQPATPVAPVETPVAAPVPVQTYRTYTPVQTYPTYSYQTYRQYPTYTTRHHHYSRDLDHDGDNQ
jgi:hypothetical protein